MKKILLVALCLTLTSQAFAGILIDPYVGIGKTKSTLDYPSSDDSDESMNVVGARLGYSFLLLSAGIDYAMESTTDNNDDTAKFTNTSIFVGVDLPILIRAWAEYFINSTPDGDTFDTYDTSFKDGYGIGVGFTMLPFVSINLEIENLNYDMEIGGQDFDFKTASTILSISLPLNL